MDRFNKGYVNKTPCSTITFTFFLAEWGMRERVSLSCYAPQYANVACVLALMVFSILT